MSKMYAADIEDHWEDGIHVSYHVTNGTVKYTHSDKLINKDNPNVSGRYLINALNKLEGLVKNQESKVERTEQDIGRLSKNKGGLFEHLGKIVELKKRAEDLDKRIAKGSTQDTTQQKMKM